MDLSPPQRSAPAAQGSGPLGGLSAFLGRATNDEREGTMGRSVRTKTRTTNTTTTTTTTSSKAKAKSPAKAAAAQKLSGRRTWFTSSGSRLTRGEGGALVLLWYGEEPQCAFQVIGIEEAPEKSKPFRPPVVG